MNCAKYLLKGAVVVTVTLTLLFSQILKSDGVQSFWIGSIDFCLVDLKCFSNNV